MHNTVCPLVLHEVSAMHRSESVIYLAEGGKRKHAPDIRQGSSPSVRTRSATMCRRLIPACCVRRSGDLPNMKYEVHFILGCSSPLCNVSPSSLHSRALDLMQVVVIGPYTHASSHLRALNRTSTRPARALAHRALPSSPPLPAPPDTTRQSQEQQWSANPRDHARLRSRLYFRSASAGSSCTLADVKPREGGVNTCMHLRATVAAVASPAALRPELQDDADGGGAREIDVQPGLSASVRSQSPARGRVPSGRGDPRRADGFSTRLLARSTHKPRTARRRGTVRMLPWRSAARWATLRDKGHAGCAATMQAKDAQQGCVF